MYAIAESKSMAMSAASTSTPALGGMMAAMNKAGYMASEGAVTSMHEQSPQVVPASMLEARPAGSMDMGAPGCKVTSLHVSCAFGASDFAGGTLQLEPLMQVSLGCWLVHTPFDSLL